MAISSIVKNTSSNLTLIWLLGRLKSEFLVLETKELLAIMRNEQEA